MADPSARLRPLKPGARTTNKCLTLLVGIMGYAVRHGFAARNAAEDMEKLPVREGESRVVEQNVLTPAELQRVMDATIAPYRMPIMLAANTGTRQAEVLGLQWGDIDWPVVRLRSGARGGGVPSTSRRQRRVGAPSSYRMKSSQS